jgi:hypothetical protein
MSRLRARIERLEQRIPATGRINWENLYRRREDIVPDGIIDWYALYEPRQPNPIERAIAQARVRAET